jgi:hypothetical protein
MPAWSSNNDNDQQQNDDNEHDNCGLPMRHAVVFVWQEKSIVWLVVVSSCHSHLLNVNGGSSIFGKSNSLRV